MKFIKAESFNSNKSIQILSLNRPEVKNAFHPEMISEITQFFKNIDSSAVTMVIMRGEGTAFCSGADLNWMKSMVDYSLQENIDDSKKLWEMFEAVYRCPVPVVSIAHGDVFGGALGLLACADYVIAEKDTQFCFSEVKLGLAPAVISAFVSRKMQDIFYRPLMISGEVFNAEEAKRIGLAHQVYTGKIEMDEVVKKFRGNGLEAMKETKKLLNALIEKDSFEKQKTLAAQVISERRTSAEGQERLKKFLSK